MENSGDGGEQDRTIRRRFINDGEVYKKGSFNYCDGKKEAQSCTVGQIAPIPSFDANKFTCFFVAQESLKSGIESENLEHCFDDIHGYVTRT